MNKRLLFVGRITASFGHQGWCRLKIVASDPSHFYKLKRAYLIKGEKGLPCQVEAVRSLAQGLVIKFRGVDSLEAAQLLKGYEIWVKRCYAQKLARGEYYLADLHACDVIYHGKLVGRVSAIFEVGAQCLLEVTLQDGNQKLVPFIKHFIKEVRPAQKRIELNEDYILQ